MKTLLQWLGFPARESTSRDLLGWLLENHGNASLNALLGLDVGAIRSLRTEQSLVDGPSLNNRAMRLDLFVEAENAIVGIEMKVHSSAGLGQLSAYADWLRARAGGKPVFLVFLTETGEVPEYPAVFEKRIAPVRLLCRTWDAVAPFIPEMPLGWGDAARARAAEIAAHAEHMLGSAPLVLLDGKPVPSVSNLRARGVLALANVVAVKTGLERVMGPTFGTYHPDPQVDLSKPTWTVKLGYQDEDIVRANPLADNELRFTIRIRFRENERGELSLGIGSTFVPYPPDVATRSNRAAFMKRAGEAFERGYAIRERLIANVPGASAMSRKHWYLSHTLIDSWPGSRVVDAVHETQKVIPLIDGVFASG